MARSVDNKSFDQPDETRSADKTSVDVVRIADTEVARLTLEPGWRWSECVKPVAQTDSCQTEHVGYLVSGRLGIRHEDGTEATLSPGEAYRIAPAHEAWVIGDETAVGIEFKSGATYAKPPS